MEWTDDAIVLSARRHGEGAAIVSLLTRGHGRHAGLVRGGGGRRARGIYQPGNRLAAHWRARLPEHLGTLQCELVASVAAPLLDDADRLCALSAACAVAEAALPEREPHPAVHAGLVALMDTLTGEGWGQIFVHWELALLAELGYGLDLSACAVTGRADALAYVSPRTGRAVSLSAGEPYRDRLLALPSFLAGRRELAGREDIAAGLALTGHFLGAHVFGPQNRALPPARLRLGDRFAAAFDGEATG